MAITAWQRQTYSLERTPKELVSLMDMGQHIGD